jgi:hypothetical protein
MCSCKPAAATQRPGPVTTYSPRVAPVDRDYTRHLTYFVCPVAGNGVWQKNVRQLLDRVGLFDGKRVCVVATAQSGFKTRFPFPGKAESARLDPPDAVRALLEPHGVEVLEVANDPGRGESVAFKTLWGAVERFRGAADVTFYAHAKGVTYPDPDDRVHRWAGLLYRANLDFWPLVRAQFRKGRLTVGTLKRVNPGPGGRHHYSGTFFWWKNRAVLTRNWEACGRNWGGVELWPGVVASPKEAGCLFEEEPHDRTAYDPQWTDELCKRFEAWAEDHRDFRTAP